jgi:hypothetical protein
LFYLLPPEECELPDEDLPDEPEKDPPDEPEEELFENEPDELPPDDGLLYERELPPELSALLREGIEYDFDDPDGVLNFLCMLLKEFDLSPDPEP